MCIAMKTQQSKTHLLSTDLSSLKIGIVGSGLMGSGIASAFLLSGFKSICVHDASDAALKRAAAAIHSTVKGALQRKKISQTEASACMKYISTSSAFDR
jgi:3-hydroxyacyl-CoA dehydrogenase